MPVSGTALRQRLAAILAADVAGYSHMMAADSVLAVFETAAGAVSAALAGAGEVLVSSTVRDLVAGSGIEFEERGTHALKGVPGEWRVSRALAA